MAKEKDLHSITIPNKVLYCDEILPNAKLLFGEITFLCSKNKNGCCWASNDYFAKLFKVSNTSISLWIKSLLDNKFIKSEVNPKNNTRKIYLKASLSKVKDNISKDILGTSVLETDVPKDNNNFIDDFKIETKEWVNKKGQTVGTDTISYEK